MARWLLSAPRRHSWPIAQDRRLAYGAGRPTTAGRLARLVRRATARATLDRGPPDLVAAAHSRHRGGSHAWGDPGRSRGSGPARGGRDTSTDRRVGAGTGVLGSTLAASARCHRSRWSARRGGCRRSRPAGSASSRRHRVKARAARARRWLGRGTRGDSRTCRLGRLPARCGHRRCPAICHPRPWQPGDARPRGDGTQRGAASTSLLPTEQWSASASAAWSASAAIHAAYSPGAGAPLSPFRRPPLMRSTGRPGTAMST